MKDLNGRGNADKPSTLLFPVDVENDKKLVNSTQLNQDDKKVLDDTIEWRGSQNEAFPDECLFQLSTMFNDKKSVLAAQAKFLKDESEDEEPAVKKR